MFKLTLLLLVYNVNAGIPGIHLDQEAIQKQMDDEAKIYLYKFGYMSSADSPNSIKEPTKEQMKNALKRFQSAFLYYSSGEVDVPTQVKMNEWRCANNDMSRGKPIPPATKEELWKKTKLIWSIVDTPLTSLNKDQVRAAAKEAFEKWSKVTKFEFSEKLDNKQEADITITFYDVPQTGLKIAASASKPKKSQIILDKNQLWAYRSDMPRGISLFHTLLHEIGHVLGLSHSFYRGSIMHPIFKPILLPFGTQNDVPNVDRLAIRKLYGLPINHSNPVSQPFNPRCPRYIDSVVAINDHEWLVFRDDKVWRVNNREFGGDDGQKIQSVFPRGPQFVNATVNSANVILLFAERTIYGYEYDGVQFTEANGYPRELHDRVLFYPQGAFPLNNGSVILLSGNAFATYNVVDNAPTFLNDKNRYFPHLPEDVRSGIEKQHGFMDEYWMFDEATVSDYDMNTKQVVQLMNIAEFFKCV